MTLRISPLVPEYKKQYLPTCQKQKCASHSCSITRTATLPYIIVNEPLAYQEPWHIPIGDVYASAALPVET